MMETRKPGSLGAVRPGTSKGAQIVTSILPAAPLDGPRRARSRARLGLALAGALALATPLAHAAAGTRPATKPASPHRHAEPGHEGHGHSANAHGHMAPTGGGPHDATVTHRFDDVEKWTRVFDDPERDAWQKPEELVKALRLAPGDTVADIGAGTGYFSRHLAHAVGERGSVYAAEVEPNLVAHLRERAEREKTPNVIPVLASFDNPRLPAASLDLVLVVDTYHHINDRLRYFGELGTRLREGGRLAIVDFEKRELPVGPGLDHKLAKQQIVGELEQAGYTLTQDLEELLPYQYLLVFTLRPPAR